MRQRRAILIFSIGLVLLVLLGGAMPTMIEESLPRESSSSQAPSTAQQGEQNKNATPKSDAMTALESLEVKGRAPKTGYTRDQFGNGWGRTNGCNTRDIILYRDLENPVLEDECDVVSGILHDPYTGETIDYNKANSSAVQIDHVVALSDAWQSGAQNLTIEDRKRLANDPLELLAVSGKENQAKSDGNAATWLPKNKAFRCEYIARQIAVKKKYSLWVTQPEKQAMVGVLSSCPDQKLP